MSEIDITRVTNLFCISRYTYNQTKNNIEDIIKEIFNNVTPKYDANFEVYIYAYIGAKSVGYIPNLDAILYTKQINDLSKIMEIVGPIITEKVEMFNNDMSLTSRLYVSKLEHIYHLYKIGNNTLEYISDKYRRAVEYTDEIINYLSESGIDLSLTSPHRRLLMISLEIGKIFAYIQPVNINDVDIGLSMRIITFMLFIGRNKSLFPPRMYYENIESWTGYKFENIINDIMQLSKAMLRMRENKNSDPDNDILEIILPLYPLCYGIDLEIPITQYVNTILHRYMANIPFMIATDDTEIVDTGFLIFVKTITNNLIYPSFNENSFDESQIGLLMVASIEIAIKLIGGYAYINNFPALQFTMKEIIAAKTKIFNLLASTLSKLWVKDKNYYPMNAGNIVSPTYKNIDRIKYPAIPESAGFAVEK